MTRREDVAIGIDVAFDAAWLVAIAGWPRPSVIETRLLHPVVPASLTEFCEGSFAVAIDAPRGPSALAHVGDSRLSPKFQRGRCSEVALSRAGISVPWITPPDLAAAAPWMRTGFAIWETLEVTGVEPLETYPHGVLWMLAGQQLRHKQRPVGLLARLSVLDRYVELPAGSAMWSHDGIDALAAAYVAWQRQFDKARRIDCASDASWPTHDGSAIWLPVPDLD